MRDFFRSSIALTRGRVLAPALGLVLGCSSLIAGAPALAQTPTPTSGSTGSTTAEARRAAGEAFDRGTSAMLTNDFRAAAHFFEQAYRLAPAAVALKQAIRAQDRAGNSFRAANLALRLRDQYPNDADGQTLATDVLDRFAAQFTEVHASCDSCAVLVNDALVSDNVHGTVRFFIQPNTTANITGSFSTGNVSAPATGAAGATVEIPAFIAPPPPPEPEVVPGQGPVAVQDSGGTPAWLFYSAVGATLAAGGVTIWSGLDTNHGVAAYEAAVDTDPVLARRLLSNGQDKERRTNILIGTTSGLAAVTVVLAIVTDWDGDPEDSAPAHARRVQHWAASIVPSATGATAVVGGRF